MWMNPLFCDTSKISWMYILETIEIDALSAIEAIFDN